MHCVYFIPSSINFSEASRSPQRIAALFLRLVLGRLKPRVSRSNNFGGSRRFFSEC
jgi:hypothetical protein